MPHEINILKHLCRKLNDAKIPYMLTGSFAANFYAVPRMTRDIDVVIEMVKMKVDRFIQVFENDFYVDREMISEAIQHHGMFNMIHDESGFKIDCIIRKETSYRSLEFSRKRSVDLDGEQIWIVSPEDLIISKLFWAKDSLSELQIKDVKNLLNALKNLDMNYIHYWVKELHLHPIFEKANL